MHCYSEEELARLALTRAPAEAAAHLAECPRCRTRLETYRRMAAQLRLAAPAPQELRRQAHDILRHRRLLAQIVGRMVTEEPFRQAVRTDPTMALAPYELSSEQQAALRELAQEQQETFQGLLDERISKRLGWP